MKAYLAEYDKQLRNQCQCRVRHFLATTFDDVFEIAFQSDENFLLFLNYYKDFIEENMRHIFYHLLTGSRLTPAQNQFVMDNVEFLTPENMMEWGKTLDNAESIEALSRFRNNVDCYGKTLLWYAKRPEVFIEFGFDPNHRDKAGQTIAFQGILDDEDVRDARGYTPGQWRYILAKFFNIVETPHFLKEEHVAENYVINAAYLSFFRDHVSSFPSITSLEWKLGLAMFTKLPSGVFFLDCVEKFLRGNRERNYDVSCKFLAKIIFSILEMDIANYDEFQRRYPQVLNVTCGKHGENILMKCIYANLDANLDDSLVIKLIRLNPALLDRKNIFNLTARDYVEANKFRLCKYFPMPIVMNLQCLSALCLNYHYVNVFSTDKKEQLKEQVRMFPGCLEFIDMHRPSHFHM